MMDTVFSVAYAGPLVTIQDQGRVGNMRFGVAASGPMDRLAFDAAIAALGGNQNWCGIEVSLGGMVIECTQGEVTIAITGGDFVVEHQGRRFSSWAVFTVATGDRLSIRAGKSGSWAYVVFSGDLQAGTWLHSRATHSTAGFGGGKVLSGTKLVVRNAIAQPERVGDVQRPQFANEAKIGVVLGPQDHQFKSETIDRFLASNFKLSDAYDRMGVRLVGPTIAPCGALSIPSEPIVRGSIQVSGDGVPTVLMADHQTTGGYPKIATILSGEVDRFAQFRAGDMVRFVPMSSDEAHQQVVEYLKMKAGYLAEISIAKGTLEQRLMSENLIEVNSFD